MIAATNVAFALFGLGAVLSVYRLGRGPSLADRMVALDQGAVIADGSIHDVLHHPEVVASYLGTNEDVIARSGDRAG